MLQEHFFRPKEARRNCVVRMLGVSLLLGGREERPTEETRAQFVGGVVVKLQFVCELVELGALPMYVAQF